MRFDTQPEWAGLAAWGDVRLGEPMGGSRSDVRQVTVGGRGCVVRRSSRSFADLDWELALLRRLRERDLDVPSAVPTTDGAGRAGRLVVFEWVDGRQPTTPQDSRQVADYLERLHEITAGWPQRPGWCTCRELTQRTRCGPVDLSLLPTDAVEICRQAWGRLPETALSVIHGDPTPPNVRLCDDRVVLLDWDEARVDVPLLDWTYVPAGRDVLPVEDRASSRAAFCAWEAALFWLTERDYAEQQLRRAGGGE